MKTLTSNLIDVTAAAANRVLAPRKTAVAAVLFASASLFSLSEARASTMMEGLDLSPYAVVSVGPAASFNMNSGPINGKVLLGDGTKVTSSGGGSGAVTGGVYTDNAAKDTLSGLQTRPVVHTVSSTVTGSAFSEASALSSAAEGLKATRTFSTQLTGTTTITGDGGLNVIDLTKGLQNDKLTLSGDSNDTFVFIVSGTFQDNEAMTLSGVSADHILWDFTGTSGNVFQTSGGDVLYGAFLDTHGGNFQFSNLDLMGGQLINTAGKIQFVSGSKIPTFVPFVPGGSVPEPSTWIMMLTGTGALGALLRRRRRLVAATL